MERAYYAVIPATVRYDKDLPANAKLLYGEITALCHEKGYCWAQNQYFADLYGVSILSVKRWINALVDKEYVFRTLTYKPNSKEVDKRYLSLKPGIEIDTRWYQNCTDPSNKNDTRGGIKNDTDNNTYMNITFNNTYKEKNIKKESVDSVISMYTENQELKDALKDFSEMRNKLKKPLTTRAMKLALKELDKLAIDDFTKIDIVNQSIVHGWQTFYSLQNKGKKEKTREEMGYAF